MDWRLIETASKNGEPFLLWLPDWNVHAVGWFSDGQWWSPVRKNGRMGIPPPSHWMFLPQLPEAD